MATETPFKHLEEDRPAKVSLPAEVGVLLLRLVVSFMVVHHGLQKLYNPEGFAQNMVAKWFPFLPCPLAWTYVAITMELVGPVLLALGICARIASFGLFATMIFANLFHFKLTGLEGFPLGVPASGAYAFEPSMLCGAIFAYFVLAGPGKLSLMPNLL
eukprot:TRINITY_DN23435_c0_g2_i1.p1 TRINITY_DN23435_c0_g2~~TRINITY_DN23435_c0_g2_i1.p1  ORF type:complete len:158 (+),score=23.53 TRINITY_DN23435_c0_g2_i1:46-519(+)